MVQENPRALHLNNSDALNHDLWRTAITGDLSDPVMSGKWT